jgi:hypothetical protein
MGPSHHTRGSPLPFYATSRHLFAPRAGPKMHSPLRHRTRWMGPVPPRWKVERSNSQPWTTRRWHGPARPREAVTGPSPHSLPSIHFLDPICALVMLELKRFLTPFLFSSRLLAGHTLPFIHLSSPFDTAPLVPITSPGIPPSSRSSGEKRSEPASEPIQAFPPAWLVCYMYTSGPAALFSCHLSRDFSRSAGHLVS